MSLHLSEDNNRKEINVLTTKSNDKLFNNQRQLKINHIKTLKYKIENNLNK